MKIVLIILPKHFLGDQKRNCPLGILYIASVLEKNGYQPQMVDLRGIDEDKWFEEIPSAEIYGISASTPEYNTAVKVAKLIKKTRDACILLGGAHASSIPKTVNDAFDKVVIGEGENAILEILRDYKNGVEKRFYQCQQIDGLDKIPFPARHLLPFNSVFSDKLVIKGSLATTIITSRGCVFNCSFCSSPKIWGRRIRHRSADNVIEEIKHIKERYGVGDFRFQDDSLALNKKMFFEMCEKIKPLKIRWRGSLHVNLVNPEILKAMKEGGCREVHYGIETISQEVLDMNNKRTNLGDLDRALKYTKDVGLRARLFFIIGLPYEKRGFSERAIEFIRKAKPEAVNLSTFVPFPGSDIFEHPSKYEIEVSSSNFHDYYMSIGLYEGEKEKDFVFKHPYLTSEELKKERSELLNFIEEYNLAYNK